ncbi:hypothetical protein MRB53_009678 [Persea americana]|uniref:Uncharacterized protein n=1 Tax=Persea americana TaxID=3435 RepID=A0ACC2LPL5_PERAE|nr:hypothetical protein MRB53_009678 [Persea americana]
MIKSLTRTLTCISLHQASSTALFIACFNIRVVDDVSNFSACTNTFQHLGRMGLGHTRIICAQPRLAFYGNRLSQELLLHVIPRAKSNNKHLGRTCVDNCRPKLALESG